MKIIFRIEDHSDGYDSKSKHLIIVNDKIMMSQREWMEPEDVRFYRDLTSPHKCEAIIKLVIEAVKNGESIEICHDETKG